MAGDKVTVCVDPLRFMHEIVKGMAELHGCGALHEGGTRWVDFYILHSVLVADPPLIGNERAGRREWAVRSL